MRSFPILVKRRTVSSYSYLSKVNYEMTDMNLTLIYLGKLNILRFQVIIPTEHISSVYCLLSTKN